MTKKKVLILTTIQGHASIAEAVNQVLERNQFSITLFSKADRILSIYRVVYRRFPSFPLVRFFLFSGWFQKLAKLYMSREYSESLQKAVSSNQPDLIVNTNYAFDAAIEKNRTNVDVPYINIITDPKTFIPLCLSGTATTNFVFDTYQEKLCRQFNPKAATTVAGWLVRDEYEQPYNKQEIRKQLGLDTKKINLLFITGSEGTEVVLKIIPSLVKLETIQITVASGTNQNLQNKLERLKQSLPSHYRKNLIPFSFTPKLYRYMQAADLVIGKAGPNSIFEAVATLTPFFATTHIPGQEDGNLSIIQDYQLGFVEENPQLAVQELIQITLQPERLRILQPHLQKMKNYNTQAKQILSTTALKLTS